MSQSVNLWIGIGNIGADPEVRATPNGAKVANFRIACSESWKDQSGQKREATEWVSIVVWNKQAEIVEKYFRKGMRVHIQGKLQTRTWEDKNGGGKRYATEVLVERFMMLDGRPGTAAEANRGGYSDADRDGEAMNLAHGGNAGDDDLPF